MDAGNLGVHDSIISKYFPNQSLDQPAAIAKDNAILTKVSNCEIII